MLVFNCLLLACLIDNSVFCGTIQKTADSAEKALGRFGHVEKFEYEGHQYAFHLEPQSWVAAVETCRKEDSYLAVLEDAFEVKFVSQAMNGDLRTKTVLQNIWIGGRFFSHLQQWSWDATGYEITGLPDDTNYPPWRLANGTGLDCIILELNLENTAEFVNIDCERKRRFLCERGCTKLYNSDKGKWSPDGCLLDPHAKGDICQIACSAGLELYGSNPLNCVARGWNNSIGFNIIPDCKTPEDLSKAIVDQLDFALDAKSALLIFMLDNGVDADKFELQKKLTLELIKIFPPTASQAVSVIMGEKSLLVFTLNETLCQVLKAVSSIEQTGSRETDWSLAMNEMTNIAASRKDEIPVIVLISGSDIANINVMKSARGIKQKSGVVLTIGFGNFIAVELMHMASESWDGLLYYSISTPDNFEKVCQRLEQVSDMSESFCDNQSDAIDIFVEKLNRTLAKNSHVLFVLKQSPRWSSDLLDYTLQFIQSLILAVTFSQSRQAGLITIDPTPNVAIPFHNDDTCAFNRHVAKIGSSSGFSNRVNGFLDVADVARFETKRANSTGKTVVVVISECNDQELENDLSLFVSVVFAVKLNNNCWGRSSLDLSSEDDQARVLQHLIDLPHDDCKTACPGLLSDVRGYWDDKKCTASGKLGKKCTFTCNDVYELIGSKSLICTEFGWEGTAGDDVLPHCKTPEEIADAFVGKLSGILDNHVDSNFLFVLDESGSVQLDNFKTELEFVDAVVDAFPLSSHRVAGLITFSNEVRNLISLQTSDTCRFIKLSKRVNYLGGGTDIHKALVKAKSVIRKRAVHPQTLVFLITDGISQTDPTAAAKDLRDDGVVIFIIGVAGYKQEQLEPLASPGPDGSANFYGVKSFQVFNQISKYLNQTYHAEGVDCEY